MARVLGKAGRYVEEQSIKKSERTAFICLIAASVCAAIAGFLIGVSLTAKLVWWIALPFTIGTLGFLLFASRVLEKYLTTLDRERVSFRKGAVGEALTGCILEGLPGDFILLNDLATPFGNIDHVVVGPTGVFAIDTKNWRGVVEADGNGELLLNGKPTSKNEVKKLVATCAETRKKIKVLCGHEPYIRGVLAFTSAHVEAPFGSVKYADCVRDERLHAYIVDDKNSPKLTKEQVESIARAFAMLAGMEPGFSGRNT